MSRWSRFDISIDTICSMWVFLPFPSSRPENYQQEHKHSLLMPTSASRENSNDKISVKLLSVSKPHTSEKKGYVYANDADNLCLADFSVTLISDGDVLFHSR